MRVRWTRRALRSLDSIADYIAQDSPLAAKRIVDKIQRAVAHLSENPQLGRPGRVSETRELIVPGTPFIIPVREAQVEILSVFHAARRWPEQF